MKYTDACGDSSANTNVVATGGIDKKGITGAYRELAWISDDSEFSSVTALKDQANWDAFVLSGDLIPLGKGKFEDISTEAAFFEDNALDIKEETTAATKSIRFTSAICSCSHAELKKMNGKTGRLVIRTSKGFVIGRMQDDGAVKGRALSNIYVGNRSVPTDDTPVEYTIVDFIFSDNEGDEKNPAEVKVDFLFSEVDHVFSAEGVASNVSSNGSTLTVDITVNKDCSGTDKLSGWLQANCKAVDEDGNELTVASFSESSGVYTIGITTALTLAYVSFDAITEISNIAYYMDQVRVSTT